MEPWLEIRPLPEATGLSRRVAERAAWRAIVRERLELPDEDAIGYNENGAPVLGCNCDRRPMPAGGPQAGAVNSLGYISVSHTRGWIAVVWSTNPCAVDIEPRDRKISHAAASRMGIAPEIEQWCAWEAAYKFKSVTGHAPDPEAVEFLPHPELVVAVIF